MQIRQEFSVHTLNDRGMSKANELAGVFTSALNAIESLGVGGRELAIVKTKLEEAAFFAKRGIAVVPENQLEPR